jgi:CheY-like chemotaxis protein
MKNVHILLVEDDAINQMVAVRFLTKWGMNVTTANNGREALEQVQSKHYNLILMDINMPEMDGYESTNRIRAINEPYFQTVPIIAFSASSMINTREVAQQYGMTDCISKPLQSEELFEKINRYVMNTTSEHSAENHSLSIDFELYTDGDEQFKSELVLMLIDNIRELRQALKNAIPQGAQLFFETFHKVTTTVSMLNDIEFTDALNHLRDHLKSKHAIDHFFQGKMAFVESRCETIVKALQKEV